MASDHGHPASCRCALHGAPASQSLDELDFLKSACSAAQTGNLERLDRLTASNPAALLTDGSGGNSGYTPLHYAARAGQDQAVELLLQRGAEVNRQTTAGRATALHRAAYMGHCSTVQLLLSHGADPMLQDADGCTALHKASQQVS
ncbi:hypothetical protein WJX84_008153 [Apatococcus fuscideae]|uniref:Uncharacterized protein n=1 Tax=Apatococcus fuscideae TaxID=2026836 RepID=A0AAW1T319_9CHLO